MRRSFIVLFSPCLYKPLCFLQIHENAFIQPFIAKLPVKALDVSVLVGLTGLDLIPSYSLFLTLSQDCHAGKFCAVITQYSGRFSSCLYDWFGFLANSAPIEGCIHCNFDTLSGQIIYYRQRVGSPPICEDIMHKIQQLLLFLRLFFDHFVWALLAQAVCKF